MTAYSEVGDLLLGDLIVGTGTNQQKFIDDAAEEMDSKIGWRYDTPIVVTGLPRHQRLLLKGINNKLASGRLILSLDAAGEGSTLHAYGYYLIKEAMNELMVIANGELDLVGAIPSDQDVNLQPDARSIEVINQDPESLLLGFTQTVMSERGPHQTRPGV